MKPEPGTESGKAFAAGEAAYEAGKGLKDNPYQTKYPCHLHSWWKAGLLYKIRFKK